MQSSRLQPIIEDLGETSSDNQTESTVSTASYEPSPIIEHDGSEESDEKKIAFVQDHIESIHSTIFSARQDVNQKDSSVTNTEKLKKEEAVKQETSEGTGTKITCSPTSDFFETEANSPALQDFISNEWSTNSAASRYAEPVVPAKITYSTKSFHLGVFASQHHLHAIDQAILLREMGENSEEEDSREHETLDQCFAVRPYTFGVNGASAIFSTLAYFPDCTVVTLSGTPLTETALTTIAGNVARLKQLRELGLSKTGIGKFNPQIICRLIRKSPFLRKLDLSDNGFTDTTASAVIDSLLSSELLAEVNLSQNHLGLEAGKMVGKLLSESYALKCLNCSWNELKADTVTEIAKGLKENSGLQELNMAWTGTSDLGAWSIGDALKKHEKLTTLNLSANRIKALGLAGLLVGLAENRSLKYLLLQQNPITEAAARDAVQALASGISSSPIQLIDLSKVVFSSSFGQLVKELEEKRPKLKLLWGYPDNYAVQSTAHSSGKEAQQC